MKKTLLVVLSAAFLTVSHASELPGYDFHYTATGDNDVRPIQIFDDGTHLYLQFKDTGAIPALFVNTPDGVTRLTVHQDFPYLVIDRLSPEILVKFGEQQAIIRYEGGRSLTDDGMMTGSSAPLAVASAASIPIERNQNAATPFASSAGTESFTGELIFNQPPAAPREVTRPAVSGAYLPTNLVPPELKPAVLTKTAFHVVSAGESITSIARKNGISIHQITLLNNLRNANLIYIGQKLIVPAESNSAAHAIEAAVDLHGKRRASYKKVTGAAHHQEKANSLRDRFVNRRVQFRVYEKTATGSVIIKEIRSLAEIGTMAEYSHAIYLRGNEPDIALRRAALAEYGVNPRKIHVIERLDDSKRDDGIVDVVFSNKDEP
ncbi:MAG: TrbG/VirB9 family P-type conjugative transfer protein [Sulfuriferula sp.]